jgi:hypothetical protein
VSVTINAPTSASYDLLIMLAYTSDKSVEYWPVLVVNDAAPAPGTTPKKLPKLPAFGRAAFDRSATAATPRITKLGMKRAASVVPAR